MKNAFSQIDVQLKRRYDLIPNLVETVKGYAAHERETLEAVTKARQQAIDVSGLDSIKERARVENMLTQTLKSLFAVSENYPDLKANENFLKLQEELTTTENKISFARQYYNDSVMQLNNKTEMFPSNIIAGMFNFKQAEFFEVEEADGTQGAGGQVLVWEQIRSNQRKSVMLVVVMAVLLLALGWFGGEGFYGPGGGSRRFDDCDHRLDFSHADQLFQWGQHIPVHKWRTEDQARGS